VISQSATASVQSYRTPLLATGIAISGLLFLWEIKTGYQQLSAWSLIPLLAGIAISEMIVRFPLGAGVARSDSGMALLFISKPLYFYHGILLVTLFLLGPANAIFIAILLLGSLLARTYYRFRTRLSEKLLELFPLLLSVWFVCKLYGWLIQWPSLTVPFIFFPVLLVSITQYLSYTILDSASVWLFEQARFFKIWKSRYLIEAQLVFSLILGVGLVSYLTARFGHLVLSLGIPTILFASTIYQIYAKTIREASRRLSEHSGLQMSIIEALALAIDAKDHSTHGHVRRVQAYAVGIARSLGIENADDLEALKTAALLHDIGKLAIPEYILSKPGRLTDAEFEKMMKHVEIGANILEPIPFPSPVVSIIRHHHERYDGTGYPQGQKGENIPLGSRILTVADTFDALTSPRPYRDPMLTTDAITLIRKDSGKAFDPVVVRAFGRVAKKLAQEVIGMDTEKFSNNTHLLGSSSDANEEDKLLLRNKGVSEIVQTQREIYSLHEIFQTFGKSLNVEDTLRIICVKLKSLVPHDSCVIYLKDKKNDMLYPAMVTGDFADFLQQNRIGLGEGLSGYAVAFNRSMVNADPVYDFKNIPDLESSKQLVNSLIVPLHHQNSGFGAIALYSKVRSEEVYSKDHVRVMETVSSQAAISIQNALSFAAHEENALTDPLTGLPNSRYMFMNFEQNLKKAERMKERIVMLVMDLNHFKQINDRFGHKVGDQVLIAVSKVLQQEMRKYDTCVRYAGDEFVGFLYNADRETAQIVVDRIRKAVEKVRIRVHSGDEVRLGISIGMSMFPEDGSDISQLFTLADSQMYLDKAKAASENFTIIPGQLKEEIDVDDDLEFVRAG
jgi:diguanylate cyclase (GGDEF)-like protein/putative nucleotidyltransferase with HDIG domain